MNLSEITRNICPVDATLPVLGEEDYKHSAVIIPLIELSGEWHVLFEERAAHIPQGGEICFPGGMMEAQDGGDGERTAQRETCEELGLKVEEVGILGALGREIGMKGLLVDIYIARIHKADLQDIDPNEEVARVFSHPLAYFLDNTPEVYQVARQVSHSIKDKQGNNKVLLPVKELGLPSRYEKPWGHHLSEVYVYQTEQATIWGLTARIIHYFIRSLVDK